MPVNTTDLPAIGTPEVIASTTPTPYANYAVFADARVAPEGTRGKVQCDDKVTSPSGHSTISTSPAGDTLPAYAQTIATNGILFAGPTSAIQEVCSQTSGSQSGFVTASEITGVQLTTAHGTPAIKNRFAPPKRTDRAVRPGKAK